MPITTETELNVDDVEEVILPEDSTTLAHKRDKSILRNNFLTEDLPAARTASLTILNHNAEDVENPEKDDVQEREDYVQSIASKLI